MRLISTASINLQISIVPILEQMFDNLVLIQLSIASFIRSFNFLCMIFHPTLKGFFSIELQRSFFITVGLRQNWKPLVTDSESRKAFVVGQLSAQLNSGTATKELPTDCSWIWQLSQGSRGTGTIPCISSTGAGTGRRRKRLA